MRDYTGERECRFPAEVKPQPLAAKNTDRELWRETPGDYYSPSIHVTEGGGIGMGVGGFVIVMPIREWHKLAKTKSGLPSAADLDRVAEEQQIKDSTER